MTAQTKCEKCGEWVEAFGVRHVCRPKEDLVYRLEKRAEIRRQIPGRRSVENNEPHRIADLLEEAANKIKLLDRDYRFMKDLAIGEEERAKELEKELRRTKFAWNMAENEIETLQKKIKAQAK